MAKYDTNWRQVLSYHIFVEADSDEEAYEKSKEALMALYPDEIWGAENIRVEGGQIELMEIRREED